MYIINSRVYLQQGDLNQLALRLASDQTGITVNDIARAVIAYENAIRDADDEKRAFAINGQDRY